MVRKTHLTPCRSVARTALAFVALAAAGAATLLAPTAPPAAHAQREAPVHIIARDGSFELLDSRRRPLEGLAADRDYLFIVENEGSEAYGAQFVRPHDDMTADDLVAAAQKDEAAFWRLATPVGGFGRLPPGRGLSVVYAFAEPGEYLVLSPPHLAQGMVATFRVHGRAASFDPLRRFDLAPDELVGMEEFAFVLPAKQPRGVRNDGQQPHEAQLVRLAEGVSLDDLIAAGGDPLTAGLAEAAGGVAALAPGMVSPWFAFSLPAGRYALLCLVPDPESGRRHFELGMAAEYTAP